MPASICPYLGNKLDSDTAMSFSSPDNRCYRREKPASLSLRHQDNYCLSSKYIICPIFNQTEPAAQSAPANSFAPSIFEVFQPYLKNKIVLAGAAAVLLLLVIVGARALRFFEPRAVTEPDIITALTEAAPASLPGTPTTSMADIILLKQPTAVEVQSIPVTVTPAPTQTVLPSQTAQPISNSATPVTPTLTYAPIFTATYCSVPAGWVKYIIRSGDTLSNLSRTYNSNVTQLQAANCMGSSTDLFAGSTLYVPYIPPSQTPTLTSTPQPPTLTNTITPASPTAETIASPTTGLPEGTPIGGG